MNIILEKTEEMKRYEKETGKQAIWQGEVTKGFLMWKEGVKNYYADKKRISLYVSQETEQKWQNFVENGEYSTLSKLIRKSVNTFISEHPNNLLQSKNIYSTELSSAASYELRQKLTTIKGFLQLILETQGNEINAQSKDAINNVLEQVNDLESKFLVKSEVMQEIKKDYDVLLIEDDLATVELITNYLTNKGYSCKGVFTGFKGLEELQIHNPKLILIDIILPDISGFDICKNLKSKDKYKELPIFYITAIPGYEVEKKMEETNADGYLLKPFDLKEFDLLFQYL